MGRKELAKILNEYIEWANTVVDRNFDPPKEIPTMQPGGIYEYEGMAVKVGRREEPTLLGLAQWLGGSGGKVPTHNRGAKEE